MPFPTTQPDGSFGIRRHRHTNKAMMNKHIALMDAMVVVVAAAKDVKKMYRLQSRKRAAARTGGVSIPKEMLSGWLFVLCGACMDESMPSTAPPWRNLIRQRFWTTTMSLLFGFNKAFPWNAKALISFRDLFVWLEVVYV